MRKKQTSQTKSLEESELGPFTLLCDAPCPEKKNCWCLEPCRCQYQALPDENTDFSKCFVQRNSLHQSKDFVPDWGVLPQHPSPDHPHSASLTPSPHWHLRARRQLHVAGGGTAVRRHPNSCQEQQTSPRAWCPRQRVLLAHSTSQPFPPVQSGASRALCLALSYPLLLVIYHWGGK